MHVDFICKCAGLVLAVAIACSSSTMASFADGTLIVYRPPASWWGMGEPPVVKVDGKTVGRMGRAKMIKLRVKAGQHKVNVTETMMWLPSPLFGSKSVTVSVPEKGTAYVRVVVSIENETPVVTTKINVNVVTAGIAAKDMNRE